MTGRVPRRPDRIGRPLSRRRFLGLMGAAGVALGGGVRLPGASSAAEPRYRSRPDLDPPRVVVDRSETAADAGSILVTPDGPLILDGAGSPVWIQPVQEATTNLQVQRYRGQPVLTWWQGRVTKYGVGHGHGVVVDARYRELARIDAARGLQADLHELVLTDRGSALLTATRLVDADLRSIGGPPGAPVVDCWVQEIDVATGSLLFEWRALDHLSLAESKMGPSTKNPFAPSASTPFDPVHLNSIQVLADGNLLLSARNTWALYKVDRTTGAILWRLGGERSDFALTSDAVFAWQHDARLHPDGAISLFDDEAAPKRRSQSRGLFLAVDWTTRNVAVGREYVHGTDPLLAGSEGSVQPLAGGDVFVGWGAKPYFSQFRPDGTMVLDGHMLQGHSYRAYRSPWSGLPTEQPSIAIEPYASDAQSVFVSWNGSTETASWRVRGGEVASMLHVLETVPRAGFETAIRGIPRVPLLVVDALSASGQPLASSPPVAAS